MTISPYIEFSEELIRTTSATDLRDISAFKQGVEISSDSDLFSGIVKIFQGDISNVSNHEVRNQSFGFGIRWSSYGSYQEIENVEKNPIYLLGTDFDSNPIVGDEQPDNTLDFDGIFKLKTEGQESFFGSGNYNKNGSDFVINTQIKNNDKNTRNFYFVDDELSTDSHQTFDERTLTPFVDCERNAFIELPENAPSEITSYLLTNYNIPDDSFLSEGYSFLGGSGFE